MSERANRKSDGFGARLLPNAPARGQSTASAPTGNSMTVDADGESAITPDVVASSIMLKETSLTTTEKRTKKQSSSNGYAEKQRARDLLLQRRSLLTHAPPDIGRIIRKKSSAAEDAHEFQKVQLRHVDVDLSPKRASALEHVNYHDALTNHVVSSTTATALQSMESEILHVSFEANCQAERATKDVVVAMTPAPIQTPTEERAESPPRQAQQLANVSHEKTAAATQSATASAAASKKDKTKKKAVAPPPRSPPNKPEEAKKAAASREKHDRPLKGFSAPTRAWLLHVGNHQPQPQSENASPQQESQPQQSIKQQAPQKQQKSQIGKHDDKQSKKRTQDGAPAKKDTTPKDEKLKSAEVKQPKAPLAEKRRSESQPRAGRKISSEKPLSAPPPVVAPMATAAARRRTPPATRPKPVVAPEELDRRRTMQNELPPRRQPQGERKEIKTAPKSKPSKTTPTPNGKAADAEPKPKQKPKTARSASLARSADVNSGGVGVVTEPSKATVVVRLHPGQARKVSKCSATSMQDEDLQSTTYLAEIHRLDCDSSPCCAAAAGLEITFEAAPQSIDIRLISDAGETSGNANVVNGTSHVDNKTRQ